MSRKTREESTAKISDGLHSRIERLSELIWASNRSQMGRDLGVDQSTVSKVLARKQEPSAKLLESLGSHVRVNAGWLFTGEGEPLVEGGVRQGVGGYRPLLDELLPGPLAEHRDRLTGVSYPVAAAFDTPTSCWHRVAHHSPITASVYKVEGGDLLLMETDPGLIRKRSAVPGRFVGLRLGGGEVATLAHVSRWPQNEPGEDPHDQYGVDTFGVFAKASLIIPVGAGGEEVGSNPRPENHLWLRLEQVVCVCLKLERGFTKAAKWASEHTPLDVSG